VWQTERCLALKDRVGTWVAAPPPIYYSLPPKNNIPMPIILKRIHRQGIRYTPFRGKLSIFRGGIDKLFEIMYNNI
jgi:hypothetical protein